MQCFSCGFHVMPGVGTCARCGADFSAASRAGSVSPPRAGVVGRAILPRWWAFQRRMAPLLWQIGLRESALPSIGLPLDAVVRPIIAMAARPASLLPGWPAFARSAAAPTRRLGWAVLLGWPLLLLVAILFHGEPIVALPCLGMALSLHAASTVTATGLPFGSAATRCTAMVTAAAALALAFYLPATWSSMRILGGSWWLVPVRVPETMPPVAEGEILWLDRGARPRPGDVVVTFRPATLRRIRAIEGQEVSMEGGVLLVDGEPSPWQSSLRPLAEGMRFTVPPNRCFVLLAESYAPGETPPEPPAPGQGWPFNRQPAWRVVVERRDLEAWLPIATSFEGRIVGRSYPVWRAGRVE